MTEEDDWSKNQKKDIVVHSREKLRQRVGKARADELFQRIADASYHVEEEGRKKGEERKCIKTGLF